MYQFLFKAAYDYSLSALFASLSEHKVVPDLAPLLAVSKFFSELCGLLAESLSSYADRLDVDAIGQVMKEALLQATSHDRKLMIIPAIASMLLLHYLATSVQSAFATRSSKYVKEPPILPHWIPFIGHLITFLWEGPRLMARLVDRFGQSVPVGIRLGPVKVYFVGDPNFINVLFKPTPAISSGTAQPMVIKNVLGMPNHILPLYYEDDSGPLLKPIPGSQVRPENRIRFFHTGAAHHHLAGNNGLRLGERYMDILGQKLLTNTVGGLEWIELPDLWLFIQNLVFPASTETLCGSSILSLNPTLTQDFWAFDQTVPTLVKGFPQWLAPGAYKARGKMLSNIKRWHQFANEHSDVFNNGSEQPDWDPYFGSKFVKTRQKFLTEIEIMDADGRASEDLGLLFATTNAIITAFWATFEVFARPHLLSRVRDIAQSAYETRSEESEALKLGNNPLLQSIFAETTRLRVVGLLARSPVHGDFQLGEWSIPQGSIIAISSRVGGMNKDVWNAGTEDDPHPLDEFWEERFLVYPDKPNSGPLRQKGGVFSSVKQESAAEKPPIEPTFSTKGLNGAYIPFGGGPGICPGRQFARQEVVCTLAKLALTYDMELQISKRWEPKMDTAYFPLGSLPPKNKVPFRIRRRS